MDAVYAIVFAHAGEAFVQVEHERCGSIFGILIAAIRHGVVSKPRKVIEQGIEFSPFAFAHAGASV